ncbi:MAG TPA: hypothetical protein VGK90_02705 [Rhizomicrobium sp.]|jgi:hypothetical protein
MTASASPIPSTSRTPLASLAGVVYAKPNFTTNPPTCLFYLRGAPASIDSLYATAASQLSGGQPANHAGWPMGATQTALDVNLPAMGFASGQFAGIAYNIDDTINTGAFDYSFVSPTEVPFNPSEAIEEEDSSASLSWISGDTFQDGTVSGPAGPSEGKTIVVVCPVVTALNLVTFNLTIVATNKNDPTEATTTTIDPKARNGG